jgi:hypothetical protein
MGQPVVHFEIIGANPEKLRSFYGDSMSAFPMSKPRSATRRVRAAPAGPA